MKVTLGIFGSILGTLVGLGVVNLIVNGSQTNLQALLGVSVILGHINGINLAVVGPNNSGVRTYGRHAAVGAVGMGLLFVVISAVLALAVSPMLVPPSLLKFAFVTALMSAIGALTGISYRAFAGVR